MIVATDYDPPQHAVKRERPHWLAQVRTTCGLDCVAGRVGRIRREDDKRHFDTCIGPDHGRDRDARDSAVKVEVGDQHIGAPVGEPWQLEL